MKLESDTHSQGVPNCREFPGRMTVWAKDHLRPLSVLHVYGNSHKKTELGTCIVFSKDPEILK